MKIAAEAQTEMNTIIAERRNLSALNRKIPQFADHIFRIGEKALAFSKIHSYCTRPFTVSYVDKRMISVTSLVETRKYLFDSLQLKPYFEDKNIESVINDESHRKKECSARTTEAITKGDPRETRFYDAERNELQALSEGGR